MLHGVPIYHGLLLAEKVLGNQLPQAQRAKQIRAKFEAALSALAKAVEAQAPKESTYGDQALRAWRACISE
jgi:hypothetical protein